MKLIALFYYAVSIHLFIATISLTITVCNYKAINKKYEVEDSNFKSIKYIFGQLKRCLIPFYNIYILISEVVATVRERFVAD